MGIMSYIRESRRGWNSYGRENKTKKLFAEREELEKQKRIVIEEARNEKLKQDIKEIKPQNGMSKFLQDTVKPYLAKRRLFRGGGVQYGADANRTSDIYGGNKTNMWTPQQNTGKPKAQDRIRN